MTDALVASPLVRAIGLALLAFLWQGALIGCVTAGLLAALRRAAAETRHLVACGGLVALALAPIVTLALTPASPAMPAAVSVTAVRTGSAVPQFSAGSSVTASDESRVVSALDRWLPALVIGWGVGVVACSVRLVRGWRWSRRVRRTSDRPASPSWTDRVGALARRLGIRRRLTLVESALAEVPFVTGWLRPAIVIPVSAFAALAPDQLEAILSHELAHIRRGDYLINVAQCVVEVLLFYHPAVWWVSKQIRVEREHCCDDLAVACGNDRLTYARALASLESLRSRLPLAMPAANGGNLLARIRRLTSPRPEPAVSGGLAMSIALTLLLIGGARALDGMPAPISAGPTPTVVSVAAPLAVAVPNAKASAVTSPAASPRVRPTTTTIEARRGDEPASPRIDQVRDPVPAAFPTITFVVIDPSGGVVPGATITISPGADQRTVTTNAAGRAVVQNIPRGDVAFAVQVPGFRTARGHVAVATDASTAVTVRLELGTVMETINLMPASGGATARPAPDAVPQPSSVSDYFDAAKTAYAEGRIQDAELLTARALLLLRSAMPAGTTGMSTAEAVLASTDARYTPVPLRVGGDIRSPRKIHDVKPAYPPEAEAANVSGLVIIEATIAKDGSVADARALSGPRSLQDSALTAVRQWKFTPTLLNGVPVEVLMTVTVNFAAR